MKLSVRKLTLAALGIALVLFELATPLAVNAGMPPPIEDPFIQKPRGGR